MIHSINSDTPFDVEFPYFRGPGKIPDQDVSLNILTCLDFMKVLGPVVSSGLKKTTSYQVAG